MDGNIEINGLINFKIMFPSKLIGNAPVALTIHNFFRFHDIWVMGPSLASIPVVKIPGG